MGNLKRREFLKTLGAGAAGLALPGVPAGAAAARNTTRPLNVLFLFADQMHGFALGCMGNREIRTPNLDRLAAEGTLFRNAYSCAPVCTPFRMNLMTGRYGSQTGALTNARPIPPGERPLAGCLNEGGHRTSYIGKWHIGASGNVAILPEWRGGFTEFIGYQCYNDFINNVWFFDEKGEKRVFNKHRTDATTDLAIERLERLAGRPFALFVSYQNPHYPMQPSPPYEAMYEKGTITRRPNCREVDPYTATASPPAPKPKENDPHFKNYGNNLDRYLRLYYAMVTQLDANLGRLFEALDRFGLRDNTVVMFTSDHGDMAGSHGLKNKAVFWEESTRIPLIVRVPGGAKGLASNALASSVDYYPSVLDYAGCKAEPRAEGVSLAPLTRGEAQNLDRPIFSEMGGWSMVREGDWKLAVEKEGLKPTHLFELQNDPYELNNLVADEKHAEPRNRLLQTITRWTAHVTKDRPAAPAPRKKAKGAKDRAAKAQSPA